KSSRTRTPSPRRTVRPEETPEPQPTRPLERPSEEQLGRGVGGEGIEQLPEEREGALEGAEPGGADEEEEEVGRGKLGTSGVD
ncbi:MAG: hypothetical protein HY561_12205, partial [Gemmatimonadetes bacterium]|nr:hypothetical protein [Gemmatimonadota bacterium]